MQSKKILVIDDDPFQCRLIELALAQEGAEVYTAHDGAQGLQEFYTVRPDLVILDVMMPRMDGWETLRTIRRLADTPVLMLTAAAGADDVIRGLDLGADDYIAKPIEPRVLAARARAAMRRGVHPSTAGQPTITYDDGYLAIDVARHHVLVQGQTISLTAKEFAFLAFLLENAGRLVTARQILEHVWGWEYQDEVDYVRVYLSHLRRKLEPDPKNPQYLITEHGAGYRFRRKASR